MNNRKLAFAVAIGLAAGACSAAIDWSNPTYSIALTKAEIEAVAGISSPAGFCSASFIKSSTGTLIMIQDPSGVSGTGLIEIDLNTKAGVVRATDAAINNVCDEALPPVDADCTGLALDTRDNSVYMMDREDTDQIIKITPDGTITTLAGVTAATVGNSGLVFADTGIVTPKYTLTYLNQDTDAVAQYDLGAGTEADLVPLANWIAVTGGTQNGFAAGPVMTSTGQMLVFDELSFGGTDQIIAFDPKTGSVSVYTALSVFGASSPGFSTMVVTSDGTVIGWDEYAAAPDNLSFIIIPGGSGTPVRIPRATIATALSVADTAIDPSDETSMLVLTDTPTQVEILFGISGTGDIGKMTFSEVSAVRDWQMFE